MILSDKTIQNLMLANELQITPLEPHQIQPASVDIRLGTSFSVVQDTDNTVISLSDSLHYTVSQQNSFIIQPNQFVLATTMEYFKLSSNLTAFVEGRSSIGRLGLFIQNAGWVDPGFEGEITLELFNASRHPILLESGRRIGQLVFAQLDRDAKNPYDGKYQGQKGATGSRVFMDTENK